MPLLRSLSLPLAVGLVACTPEPAPVSPTPPPATTMAAATTAPAMTAPPPATTTAARPTAAPTADLGQMSNDPETDRKMREEVTRVAQDHPRAMRVCYNDAIRRNPPNAKAEIDIKLTVAPSGEAVVIEPIKVAVADADFVTCLRAALSTKQYPKWQGKAVTVTLPFEFLRKVQGPGEE